MSLLSVINDKLEYVRDNHHPWIFVLVTFILVVVLFSCVVMVAVGVYEIFQKPLITARVGDLFIGLTVFWFLTEWSKN